MKTLVKIVCSTLLVCSACAQVINTYTWKATLKVIDENGAAFFGAPVCIGFYTNSVSTGVDGVTDTNGLFSVTHAAQSENAIVSFEAKKEGYYSILQDIDLGPPYNLEKWSPNKILVLKKVCKPIAMYAKQITSLKVPEFNKAIGYDLMIGDWVGIYGKGINADLFFTEKHTDPKSGYILSVSFPKPGDGIQEFSLPDAEKGSGLRSSHEAPVDGYQPEVAQTTMTNPNRNFYFRVRTKLDESCNVVSARYGKIYGDLAQFAYYFNPTLNGRNVEFDPKQNLISGLDALEQVTAP